jgi:hypothetical protein
MTSSRQYNRICLFCRTQFVAQKRTTKYCSHRCASRAYKVNKKRQDAIEVNFEEFVKRELMIHTETLLQIQNSISQLLQVARLSNEEYIPVEDYCSMKGISRKTLSRWIKEEKVEVQKISERKILIRL